MYGLTIDETEYVWVEYRKTIKDKIKNKPLNESTEDNALNTIVDQLVNETNIDYGTETVFAPFISTLPSPFFSSFLPSLPPSPPPSTLLTLLTL